MYQAYVDTFAKDNNGVKYLLIRQKLFDRTVEESIRIKVSQATQKVEI